MVRHGRHCAVAVCRNHDKSGKHLSFFRFPKDPSLREVWILMCKREDSFNANTARICSEHFKNEDFARDLRAELLGIKPRKTLVPKAVPSLKVDFEMKFITMKKKICNTFEKVNKDPKKTVCSTVNPAMCSSDSQNGSNISEEK